MTQDKTLDMLVNLGMALGSRARVKVLRMLLDDGGVESVSELARRVAMPLSTVGHHVGVLVTCGFVEKEPCGRDVALLVRGDVEAMLGRVFAWAGESEGEGDAEGDTEGDPIAKETCDER